LFDANNSDDLNFVWNALQNNEFNVHMVGAILAHKWYDLGSEATIWDALRAYNGSGTLAESYLEAVMVYFEIFYEFNNN